MSEHLSDTTVDEPPSAAGAAPEPAVSGIYPRSAEESAEMIGNRRAGIASAEKLIAATQVELNRLQNEISVLNSLRQANGQAPL